MKNILIFSFLAIPFVTLGQTVLNPSLQVTPAEQHLSSDDLWSEMVTEIVVENISSNSIDVKVKRQLISLVQGSENYFCWTQCYDPIISESPDPITMDGGAVNDSSLSVHYAANGNIGQVSVKYCAFDANNEADSACTIIYFNGTSTAIDEISETPFSEFHPNPTRSTTILNYNLPSNKQAEVLFLDMMGNLMKKHQLVGQDGQLKISVSDLKAGLYFANIVVDGQLKEIKRLVVTK